MSATRESKPALRALPDDAPLAYSPRPSRLQYSAGCDTLRTVNHAAHIRVTRVVGLNDRGYPVGESNGKAKLTQALVNEIRDLHEVGLRLGYRRLARRFGIPRDTVRRICTYERWQTPTQFKRVVVQGVENQASNHTETERGGPLHCKPVDESGKSDG